MKCGGRLLSLMCAALGLAGCVSSHTHELALKNAETAQSLYQTEQRRVQEMATTNKQLKMQVDELEAKLKLSREQLMRIESEWKEARDELLRIKIEREQSQKDSRRAGSAERSEPPSALESEGDGRTKEQRRPGDPKRRLRDLVRELEGLLER